MRRFEEYKLEKALKNWSKVRNPIRVTLFAIAFFLNKFNPFLGLKTGIYKLFGIKIHSDARIAFGVWMDFFFPESIEIKENSVIGFNTLLLTHEFHVNAWRKGKIEIGKNVLIGANCTIMPGVKIGDNATVAAMSLINKDIPAGETWGGIPAKRLK